MDDPLPEIGQTELMHEASIMDGHGALAMPLELAEHAARRVLLHLLRGSIEQARETLDECWRTHVVKEKRLPIGSALLAAPLAEVLDDVMLLNLLERDGITTVGGLLGMTIASFQKLPNLGEVRINRLVNLATGLRVRALATKE